VDARTDIFSFGAVLYEMVTGQRAFRGDSKMATLQAVLAGEPRPVAENELGKIILRCLRKDPARRYQTMADLKIALEDLREAPGRPASKWRSVGAVALLAAVAVGGVLVWKRPRHDTIPPTASAFTTMPGEELYPSLSPDGNHVVFTWTGPKGDNADVYVQLIGSGPPLRLTTDPRADLNPVWSPDGRWIAYLRGTPAPLTRSTLELRLVPPLGGQERKLAEVRINEFSIRPVYLAWSRDSKALVVTDSPGEGKPDALFVVSVEGGEKRQLTHPRSPIVSDTSPALAPDGRALVFRRSATWDSGELHLLPLRADLTAAGEPGRLTSAALGADYPVWLGDGKEILFSARGHLWRQTVAGGSAPARLPFVGEDGLMPTVSRSRLVYVRSFTDENIWRIETSAPGVPSTAPPALHVASTRSDLHPMFSPDERRIAFTSTRSGGWELWLADAGGANAVQLTSMGARTTGAPYWSPDGQTITFASDLEGQFDIYRIAASGGRPQRLTSDPSFDHGPKYSADGRWIYFSSTRTGRHELWKMPASGGTATQVTNNGGFTAAPSPDGSWLYYAGSSPLGAPLWRVRPAGGDPARVLDSIGWWNLAVLDEGIYFTDLERGESRLRFFDFQTRTPVTVSGALGNIQGGITATRDGKTILFNRTDSAVDDLVLVEGFR
jgi:Tol biopolymer transport system component